MRGNEIEIVEIGVNGEVNRSAQKEKKKKTVKQVKQEKKKRKSDSKENTLDCRYFFFFLIFMTSVNLFIRFIGMNLGRIFFRMNLLNQKEG